MLWLVTVIMVYDDRIEDGNQSLAANQMIVMYLDRQLSMNT